MTEYSDNYEQFWKAYPKRNGRKAGKRPAFNQWNKLTADERRAAFVDVEKRNRQHGWGKYIKDALRYLRDHGWEDEWEPAQGQLLRAPAQPSEPEAQLPWVERMMNRLFKSYVLAALGLPDVKRALSIKHEILTREWPDMAADIEAGTETKASVAKTIAGLFLGRLDATYGLNKRGVTLRTATAESRRLNA